MQKFPLILDNTEMCLYFILKLLGRTGAEDVKEKIPGMYLNKYQLRFQVLMSASMTMTDFLQGVVLRSLKETDRRFWGIYSLRHLLDDENSKRL
jgi:hypothetical protein